MSYYQENPQKFMAKSFLDLLKDLDDLASKVADRDHEISRLKAAMQLHAGDVCSLNGQLNMALEDKGELEKENEALRGALEKLDRILEMTDPDDIDNGPIIIEIHKQIKRALNPHEQGEQKQS